MAEIIKLPLITQHELDASEMLAAIAEDKPKNAFVVVWPEDGTMPTYHSTTSDVPTVLMRLREFEHKYFSGDFYV
jgi:hypothetical protein